MTLAQAPPEAEEVPLRRNRDFQFLWAGSALSVLAERFSAMAFTLLVIWSGGSKIAAGLVAFAALLPMLLVQLPAGVLVDRWSRRRVMLACVAGRLAGIASVAAAVAADRVWVPHLAAVAFAQGTMTVFYQLAERATVRAVVPGSQLPAAMAQNEARGRGANFVGHPTGGVLFGLTAYAPFLTSTVFYLASLVAMLRLRTPPQPPAKRRSWGIGAGLRWVWGRRYFRTALLLIAGSNLLFQGVILTLQVVVKEQGRSSAVAGLIMAAGSVGGLAGAVVGGWWVRRMAMRHIMVVAYLAWALVMPGLVVVSHPVAFGGLFFTTSLIGAATTVAGMVYQLRITPDAMQGRVGSVVLLLTSGASSVGALGTGFLLEAVSTTRAFAVMSAAMGLLALITAATFLGRKAAEDEKSTAGMGNL
ncbi:MFS transporter [Phytohabitans sp. ZYX-F-186]|uniref:MFS transporter n=1 Tax=Phytohabitans maris TaxID=3071409 RepID=A0ABU0Z996_9ACTN|nr:MFS transporter [Phytohabitans sp. ZYX-F-186]MDQ7903616.1 MFS transporter [Phytohabitans sp. ZYX-F-186]